MTMSECTLRVKNTITLNENEGANWYPHFFIYGALLFELHSQVLHHKCVIVGRFINNF